MANYLKLFNEHTQYEAFIGGGVEAVETYGKFEKPNVSHCITDGHVHYNPSDYKITGKFTVPSKLLNVVEGNASGGGETPIKLRTLSTSEVSLKLPSSPSSSSYSSCYGLDMGIKQENPATITYSDGTEILNVDLVENGTITDSQNGNEYRIVDVYFPYMCLDDTTDELSNGNRTATNQEDGETYYYGYNKKRVFRGRIGSNNVLECGSYNEVENQETGEYELTWQARPIPKIVNRTVNHCYNNGDDIVFEKVNFSCIYQTVGESSSTYSESHMYNGTLDVVDNITTYTLIANLVGYTPSSDTPKVSTLSVNDVSLKDAPSTPSMNKGMAIKSIKLDGVELDINDLAETDGWYVLEDGVHNIEYLFDFDECFYGFKEILYTPYLMGVPVESVVLDGRLQGIGEQVFKGCALLNTEERFINKICTIKDYNNRTGRLINIEPIVMDCEFEDENDYISYSRFTNNDYYALHDGKVGMHVCEFEQGSEGVDPSRQK